jgi:N-glycosylase/DNA lyase
LLRQLRLRGEPLNLDLTMDCGQIFRWKKDEGFWKGWLNGSRVEMRIEGDILQYRAKPPITEDMVVNFLTLDLDYMKIYDGLPRDETTSTLIQRYRGLRILRQNPWECSVSYIISASMSIRSINAILNRICWAAYPKQEPSPFPTPQDFLKISPPRANYLGKKWFYLARLANILSSNPSFFKEFENLSYLDAWNKLVKGNEHIMGVGPKVADCVLLFSLNKFDAFPIDRWVLRGLKKFYPRILEKFGKGGIHESKTLTVHTYASISESARMYFGRYCGILQESIFLASRINDTSFLQCGL